jgi:hypothetical protein
LTRWTAFLGQVAFQQHRQRAWGHPVDLIRPALQAMSPLVRTSRIISTDVLLTTPHMPITGLNGLSVGDVLVVYRVVTANAFGCSRSTRCRWPGPRAAADDVGWSAVGQERCPTRFDAGSTGTAPPLPLLATTLNGQTTVAGPDHKLLCRTVRPQRPRRMHRQNADLPRTTRPHRPRPVRTPFQRPPPTPEPQPTPAQPRSQHRDPPQHHIRRQRVLGGVINEYRRAA